MFQLDTIQGALARRRFSRTLRNGLAFALVGVALASAALAGMP